MKNPVADWANLQVLWEGQFIANHKEYVLENGGQSWMHIIMAYCSLDKKDEWASGYKITLSYSTIQLLSEPPYQERHLSAPL
jgi:hypothetical protein